MAACLVEDEKRPDALLSDPSLNSHRGLAWWGEEFEFNSSGVSEIGTIPITDEGRISKFLDIFGCDLLKQTICFFSPDLPPVTFTLGTTVSEGSAGNSMAGEHMTSFDYAYKLEAVRDWLFSQSKK